MKLEQTLKYKIDHDIDLTECQALSFYNLLSKGCQVKTKNRLYVRIIQYGLFIFGNYGIYERVYWDDKENCRYCAGQSYPDEIRTVRNCILGK